MTRVQAIKPRTYQPRREVLQAVGEVAREEIIKNIRAGKQASGADIKRPRGGGQPLIDKRGRFVSVGNWAVRVLGHVVEVRPVGELANLVKWVQQGGFVGWFAVSRVGLKRIKELLRERLKRART